MLTDQEMKWDHRFLQMANLVSQWSKDPSTKTGSVIVRPDRTVCSVGYNGFPAPMEDRPEWLAYRPEKYSRVIHAEINALLSAREPVKGYSVYAYPLQFCDRCVVHLAQAGITRFVSMKLPEGSVNERWEADCDRAMGMISVMGLEATLYPWHKGGVQEGEDVVDAEDEVVAHEC